LTATCGEKPDNRDDHHRRIDENRPARLHFAPGNWRIARNYAQSPGGGQLQIHVSNGCVKLGVNRRIVFPGTIGGIPPDVLNVADRNILSLNIAVEYRSVQRVTEFDDNVVYSVWKIGMANQPNSPVGIDFSPL
jgi:hypothetical protein